MQPNASKKSSQKDWTRGEILCALYNAGTTLSKLAFELGLRDSSGLSKAITQPFPLGEKRIAARIGVHPKVIWPSRYNVDGSRKPTGMRAIQCTAAMRARNGKEALAA